MSISYLKQQFVFSSPWLFIYPNDRDFSYNPQITHKLPVRLLFVAFWNSISSLIYPCASNPHRMWRRTHHVALSSVSSASSNAAQHYHTLCGTHARTQDTRAQRMRAHAAAPFIHQHHHRHIWSSVECVVRYLLIIGLGGGVGNAVCWSAERRASRLCDICAMRSLLDMTKYIYHIYCKYTARQYSCFRWLFYLPLLWLLLLLWRAFWRRV